MIPKPPTWISPRTTHCPKRVSRVPGSKTTSPVTHWAEVEVNRASMKDRGKPRAAHGDASRIEPSRMETP